MFLTKLLDMFLTSPHQILHL